jgi:menaquinone-9 beta-reductase
MKMPSERNDYEVIIVGGGPTGVSTWLFLNKISTELAHKTLLLEKTKYPREKICGGALGGWTEKSLKQLDIEMNIPSFFVDHIECKMGNDLVQVHRNNFFRIIQRHEFDQRLAEVARNRGSILHENESFEGLERVNDGLLIRTNLAQYHSRVLIGADGALSSVRKQFSISERPVLSPGISVINPANLEFDLEFEKRAALLDFTPVLKGLEGYIWHFPCYLNGQKALNHGIVDFKRNSGKEKVDIKKIFLDNLKSRNVSCQPESLKGYPIPWFKENRALSKPNILLAGDAAGIEPAIGGGIHLAFSYGELAASSIVDAFNKNDFGFEDFLDRYTDSLVGKYISKLNYLSGMMYSDPEKTLAIAKEIFNR